MKNYLIPILAITMILLPIIVTAKPFGKTGTVGMQFLKLGVDARAIGMGEAYTAVTDDISSVYWNPAGLAPSYQNQVFFSHTNWPADIMHEFAAGSFTNGVSTVAVYGSVLHMDDMDVTDEDTFDITGEKFTNSSAAMGVSYAQQFTNKFSAGFGVKYLRENLYTYSINGYSIDMGSMYNTGWKNVKIGMTMRNFGPDIRYSVDDDDDGEIDEDPYDLFDNDNDGIKDEDGSELDCKIPMSFSLGISGDIKRDEMNYWIASFQLDNVIDRMETWNLGTEYKMGNIFFRGGYQINYDANGLSVGLGWQVPTSLGIFNVDYAYTDMGYLSENFFKSAHRVSVKLRY